MKIDLSGATALVTGSTRGIGLGIARRLMGCGARVVIHGRGEDAVAKAISQLDVEFGGTVVNGVAADISTAAGCTALIAKLPDVDILVNNAGVFEWRGFFETSDEDWSRMLEINLMAGVRLARAYMPAMLASNWGRIVFIASDAGVYLPPEMIHYGVSKAAEIGLARGLAELTAGSGVTVNAVLPGPTFTEGADAFYDKYAQSHSVSRDQAERHFIRAVRPSSLLQRSATVDEVASLVTYACSREASATNGSALRAEGGIIRGIV